MTRHNNAMASITGYANMPWPNGETSYFSVVNAKCRQAEHRLELGRQLAGDDVLFVDILENFK